MKFNDVYVDKLNGFSIGIEVETLRHYLSIPVSNGMVDYEEYFNISKEQFDLFLSDDQQALHFVNGCRDRKHDDLLFFNPGSDRGSPR